MTMRKLLMVMVPLAVICTGGCAMVEPDDFAALQSQVYRNQRDIKKLSGQLEKMRKPQADTQADQTSLRQDMARLTGQIEENRHRLDQMPDAAAMIAQVDQKAAAAAEASTANSEAAKADTKKRLAQLEKYLGIKGGKMPPKPNTASRAAVPKPPQNDKGMYKLGKRLYQQKSYKAARDQFEGLLKKYPKSKLAAVSVYYVGQTYYAQKKYEEAILNYNQVIKRYKRSSIVPAAMLKQGLGFLKLGDKHAARIVFNKLIKAHPKSSQAKSARRYLRKLK